MADTVDITNVTALHPKAERRTRSKPDRTNSERQKRFRDKRKTQLPVTHEGAVTVPIVDKAPTERNGVTAPAKRDGVTVAHPDEPATPRIEVLPPRYRPWSAIGRAGVGLAIVVTGGWIAYTSMRGNS